MAGTFGYELDPAKMTEEERKAIPILGGMHPLQSQAQQIQGQLDGASVCENMDDLPF